MSRNKKRKTPSRATMTTYKADWDRMHRYAAPAFEGVLPAVLSGLVTEYCLGIPGRYYFSRHVLYGDHGLKSKTRQYTSEYRDGHGVRVPLERRLLLWLRHEKQNRA